MSSKSRHKIGWLSPFLSLLTIGLAKPDNNIAAETGIGTIEAVAPQADETTTPAVAAVEVSAKTEPAKIDIAEIPPADLEPANLEPAILEPASEGKSLDWGKARDFRLAARLSVNAQLNRPKSGVQQTRKVKTVTAPAARWNRTSKSTLRNAHPALDSAVVIKFPNPGHGDKHLAEAA